MWPNPQFPADLVTFTEEILNWKLHFMCNVISQKSSSCNPQRPINFANEQIWVLREEQWLLRAYINFYEKNDAIRQNCSFMTTAFILWALMTIYGRKCKVDTEKCLFLSSDVTFLLVKYLLNVLLYFHLKLTLN